MTRKAAALVILVIVTAAVVVTISLYEAGHTPSCSGYPPTGNCPGNYSYTFTIVLNYTGSWKLAYIGYRSLACTTGNYTEGSFQGAGPATENVTLSGPNDYGLTLLAQAEKSDSSSSVLTISVENQVNQTSMPHGVASVCFGVVP